MESREDFFFNTSEVVFIAMLLMFKPEAAEFHSGSRGKGTTYVLGTVQSLLGYICALFSPQESICKGGLMDFYPYFGNEDSEAQRS